MKIPALILRFSGIALALAVAACGVKGNLRLPDAPPAHKHERHDDSQRL